MSLLAEDATKDAVEHHPTGGRWSSKTEQGEGCNENAELVSAYGSP